MEESVKTYSAIVTKDFRLGAETDDTMICLEDWLKKARDAGWTQEIQAEMMLSMAFNPAVSHVFFVAVIGLDDVRLKGIYVAYTGICSGKMTLQVPLINFVARTTSAEENGVVAEIARMAEERNCEDIAVSVLKNQKDVEEALRRVIGNQIRLGGKVFVWAAGGEK